MSRKANTGLHVGLLWLRIIMGFGMAYHGFGKVFGGNMDGFIKGVGSMGFPQPELFAWAAALSEFVGGLLLVIGLLTRPAALFVFATMFVAAFIKHSADPFSTKELAIGYMAIAGAIMLTGAGRYSIDDTIKRKYMG